MINAPIVLGQKVTKVVLKNGASIDLCYPKWQDLDSLLHYINTISAEDTFIMMSGEQMTISDEANYLARVIDNIKNKLGVTLFAIDNGLVVGVCGIDKTHGDRVRASHRAGFGISIAKEYRGLGLGKILMQTTIGEAKKHIFGLKIINLDCFEMNTAAVKLYQKLGFEITGKLRNAYFYKGGYQDSLNMALYL